MFDLRKLFQTKGTFLRKRIDLDAAVQAFVTHARGEASRLRDALIPLIAERCLSQSIELRSILERPLTPDRTPDGKAADRTLFDAHIYAYALASGMACLRNNPEVEDRANAAEHVFYRLIAAEDVGASNVGSTPSPWLASGTHVQWAPGTFTGTPSEQKALVNRYRMALGSAMRPDSISPGNGTNHCLIVFMIGLGLLKPSCGVRRRIYQETSLTDDLVVLTEIDSAETRAPIESWSDDIVIDDANAALARIPLAWLECAHEILESVDPFWPTFTHRYRLAP